MSSNGTRTWTQAQRAGIETVDRSLLVSAAAGSGKTTVLAERVVHLICDEKCNCKVDELLVVTFTEAAAAEMKSRIARALHKRHAGNPTAHITRELALIDRAAVGTLHSFCARLLRQHFHLLGLDPSFIILDGDETALLKIDTVRELFADRYDVEGSDSFRALVDHYGDGKDDRLGQLVIQTHDTLSSVTDPQAWIDAAKDRVSEAVDLPLHQSFLGKEYLKSIERSLVAIGQQCNEAIHQLGQLKHFSAYIAHLVEIGRVVDHWLVVLQQDGVDAMVEEVNSVEKLPTLPRVSGQTPDKDFAKAIVDDVKDAIKNGTWRSCATFTEAQWQDGLEKILPHVEIFLDLVQQFGQRYTAAKDEEGGLDFSDLERLTLRALSDPDSKKILPSSLARFYHRQFRHVLVDEYQDINEVQDTILSLISRECVAGTRNVEPNLFCVGDVKQSIYRFRLAEAGRFIDRSIAYSQRGSHGTLIALQNNYRSRGPLLEAINGVFERLMTADAADFTYDQTHRLTPGLEFPPATNGNCFTGAPIELHLLPREVEAEENSDAAEADRTQREAKFLAHRILQLTGKLDSPAMQVIDRAAGEAYYRPVRYNDIVILLRSMRYKADVFAEELRAAGIPVHSESPTGYFEATEVNDVLSLLQVLDNQNRDIPLASLLRSPLAGLATPDDDLACIRLAYSADDLPIPFHQAVIKYANEKHDALAARLRDFFKQLSEWRRLARQRPLAEVLWTIFDQTGYLTFCSGLPNGEQRQANLIELHERARQFGTFRRQGLSRFLQFLEKLKADSDLGQAQLASEAEDVVRILTIHRSKGLEFPVVLLPDLGKMINLQDCQGAIVLDRHAGIGFQVVDLERYIRYPSLASVVVQQRLRQQSLAEELRVLYVAMTRAKEHLILLGTVREKQQEKWQSQWTHHRGPFPTEAVLGARTMLDWLGPVAAAMNGAGLNGFCVTEHSAESIAKLGGVNYDNHSLSPQQQSLAKLQPLADAVETSTESQAVIDRVNYKYPFAPYAKVRATQSATAQGKQDAEIAPATTDLSVSELDRMLPRAEFLTEAKPSAADRGTATHAVLEHFNFSKPPTIESITQQVNAMVDSHQISRQHAKLVDIAAIQWLLADEVGAMLHQYAHNLIRELPIYFAMPSDAASVTPTTDLFDQVMIRGRLDLLVDTPEGLIIIDYKTDRVTGPQIDERAELYAGQLKLYRDAIERITKRPVARAILVFLSPRETRNVLSPESGSA